MKKQNKLTVLIIASISLQGCANLINPAIDTDAKQVNVSSSYLSDEQLIEQQSTAQNVEDQKNTSQFTRLNSLKDSQAGLKLEIDLSKQFSDKQSFQVSVNALPLNDFIHYTLGELLNVSYLIEPSIKSKNTPVTLELKEEVSGQKLFQLVQTVLTQNDTSVSLNDGVLYLYPLDAKRTKSDQAFGFGRTAETVPNVTSDIIQLVPIKYGVSTGLRSSIAGLVDAQISIDPEQGLVTIKGKREQVLRALSLIELIDSPVLFNKAMALMSFTYIDSQTFIEKTKELLSLEGINAETSRSTSSSVFFVPIEHLGQVVVFATADEILDRVEYWSKQLDKPATGSEQSFFIYHPKFARAADLGLSLAPLLGGTNVGANRSRTAERKTPTSGSTPPKEGSSANLTVEGDGIKLVVDERANALIFYSTGKYYQELQPILNQLDIMPKQVMMEVVIAEVKLTGSFAKGVEFAIKNGSLGNTSNTVNFEKKGGFGYSVVGLGGNVSINFNQTDGLVNVLSRPTLLVRDGVSATISVGDDIPTVGSTTSDPINGARETTTIQYRKTGVDLTVTPTINAQGTVIMTIEQTISNVNPDGDGGTGTPAIFERSINTEVVAGNGQTVLLGGLISQNSSTGASSIPWFGHIPILGHLFRSDTSSSDKTELVVLVTPKIVQNAEDWKKIETSFKKGLENLVF